MSSKYNKWIKNSLSIFYFVSITSHKLPTFVFMKVVSKVKCAKNVISITLTFIIESMLFTFQKSSNFWYLL